MSKVSFLQLKLEDWSQLCAEQGWPTFRAQQIWHWLYKKRQFSLSEMTNLSVDMRTKLSACLDWQLPKIESRLDSQDGASKLLLASHSGHLIEAVLLRYEGRTSLCVSSQVGCKLACRFCQTGKLGFIRHLSRAEILAQFAIAQDLVGQEGRRISHVVFMGMGEPLDNYDATVSAAQAMIDDFGLSRKNVTLSTSGLTKKIRLLAQNFSGALAISLHAARDELRSELMPINRKSNLGELKEALHDYQQQTGNKLTIEYILIRDKNCGRREAKELVSFLHGLRVKINLIPFNHHPGSAFLRPTDEQIRDFQSYLTARSFAAPVRYSKGNDVSGACGQLAAKQQNHLKLAPERKRLISCK